MSDCATRWCVRFKLDSGSYTASWIHRHGEPIGRDEVEEWATRQVDENDEYVEVDEIYVSEEAEK